MRIHINLSVICSVSHLSLFERQDEIGQILDGSSFRDNNILNSSRNRSNDKELLPCNTLLLRYQNLQDSIAMSLRHHLAPSVDHPTKDGICSVLLKRFYHLDSNPVPVNINSYITIMYLHQNYHHEIIKKLKMKR